MTAVIRKTELGFRIGGLEALLGTSGKGQILRANSLVLDGPRPIVVDPSGGAGRHEELAKQNPILFYTHYHADHRASEHHYPLETEAWASANDAAAIRDLENFALRVEKRSPETARRLMAGLQVVFKIGPRPVAREMDDGQWLDAGGTKAQEILLAGHTPGHAGLFFPEESLLFITDIDLTPFGPWYGNDVSDLDLFKASIRKARDFECDWYFTSHIEEPLPREAFLPLLDAFGAHFARRDNLILDSLSTGTKSVDDLCRLGLVYKPSSLSQRENLIYFEKKHIEKHLQLLLRDGKVRADEKAQRYERA